MELEDSTICISTILALFTFIIQFHVNDLVFATLGVVELPAEPVTVLLIDGGFAQQIAQCGRGNWY